MRRSAGVTTMRVRHGERVRLRAMHMKLKGRLEDFVGILRPNEF